MGNKGFTAEAIGDQSGKVAIVTGSNTGIGKITALELARKGCHVIMACRSRDRTVPVVDEIREVTGNDRVEFMELNLSSLKSVAKFVREFKKTGLPLHLLINNAGVMACPFKLSEDGIELQWATNHLGHFLLTTSLLDVIEASAPARIVNVSSMGHKMTSGLELETLNDEKRYGAWNAYARSKLSNILFSLELQKRIGDKQIWVNSIHPGYVATELTRNVSDLYGSIAEPLSNFAASLFALPPEKGALTTLYVATSPDIESNDWRARYFVPIAKLATTSKAAMNEEAAKQLWEFSEKLVAEKLGDAVGDEDEVEDEDKHSNEGASTSGATATSE